MHFFGATIIAALVFFVLNYVSSMVFGGPQVTAPAAFVEAVLKTAVFAVIFHYLHNWLAGLLGWYRLDEPEKQHFFDRSPALEAERARLKSPEN